MVEIKYLVDPDWREPKLARWLGGIVKENTLNVYKSAYKRYWEWLDFPHSDALIKEAADDARLPYEDRQNLVRNRLLQFHKWLKKSAPKRDKWGNIRGYGLAPKMARTYMMAVRSFYAEFDFTVRLKGRSALRRPEVQQKRLLLSNLEVQNLIDHCASPRDRCIVAFLFQGGLIFRP